MSTHNDYNPFFFFNPKQIYGCYSATDITDAAVSGKMKLCWSVCKTFLSYDSEKRVTDFWCKLHQAGFMGQMGSNFEDGTIEDGCCRSVLQSSIGSDTKNFITGNDVLHCYQVSINLKHEINIDEADF